MPGWLVAIISRSSSRCKALPRWAPPAVACCTSWGCWPGALPRLLLLLLQARTRRCRSCDARGGESPAPAAAAAACWKAGGPQYPHIRRLPVFRVRRRHAEASPCARPQQPQGRACRQCCSAATKSGARGCCRDESRTTPRGGGGCRRCRQQPPAACVRFCQRRHSEVGHAGGGDSRGGGLQGAGAHGKARGLVDEWPACRATQSQLRGTRGLRPYSLPGQAGRGTQAHVPDGTLRAEAHAMRCCCWLAAPWLSTLHAAAAPGYAQCAPPLPFPPGPVHSPHRLQRHLQLGQGIPGLRVGRLADHLLAAEEPVGLPRHGRQRRGQRVVARRGRRRQLLRQDDSPCPS